VTSGDATLRAAAYAFEHNLKNIDVDIRATSWW
jgi:hypothetical protein